MTRHAHPERPETPGPRPWPCLKAASYRSAWAAVATAVLIHAPCPAFSRSAQASLCVAATAQVERAQHIPEGFLYAMGRVESGRPDPDGTIAPWPWTITANGIGHYYSTRAEAIAAVESLRLQGIQSIDVGCMQVNLQQHPDAFASLDQAFDPMINTQYAGRFLLQMHDKTGSWPRAAAAYHSQTPGIGTPYQWKVLEAWAIPQDGPDSQKPARPLFGGPAAFPHPVMAKTMPKTVQQTAQPQTIADADQAGGEGEESPAPVRAFHPFQGFAHFSQPVLRRPATSGMRGRALASYRANPVPLAGPTG